MASHRCRVGALVVCAVLVGCTHSGEIYDKTKHSKADFSKGRTAAAVLGTVAGVALIVAGAQNGAFDGGGYTAPRRNYGVRDYDWAWDYQPANNQWVCRGKQTGEYAFPVNCQYDARFDTWPG